VTPCAWGPGLANVFARWRRQSTPSRNYSLSRAEAARNETFEGRWEVHGLL
jgi:hypothetical protein